MRLFGIAGWSGSGKTTMLVRLIPALVRRGLRVATIKHTHHVPELGDAEMRALAAAGAVECVAASEARFALVHDLHGSPEPGLDVLSQRVGEVDLLLVEGFKFSPHPKLEVWDPASGKELRAPGDRSIVALACDAPSPVADRPVFARDDVDAIAAFVCRYCGLGEP